MKKWPIIIGIIIWILLFLVVYVVGGLILEVQRKNAKKSGEWKKEIMYTKNGCSVFMLSLFLWEYHYC